MNINYQKITLDDTIVKCSLDKNKKNILILGPSNTDSKRGYIINPKNKEIAFELYGDSDLYNAYENAFKITNDNNIYLCNCYTTSDYLNIFDKIVQYDFDYIVPINIFLSDVFYDIYTNDYIYYANYFLNELFESNSLSTLIMTDKHASLYEDMDIYLKDMNEKYLNFISSSSFKELINYGSNMIIVYNMLHDISYSNVILSAMLSINSYNKYPKNINLIPVFDFDKNDLDDSNYIYFKFNYYINSTSVENLLNLRIVNDIYKNILISELIKFIIKLLNFDEFKGKLLTNYTKLQISNKIKNILKPYINKEFKDYSINKIGFIKTDPGTGYIYLELSITPFGLIDNINIVMEI